MIYFVLALLVLGLITAFASFLGRKKDEEEAPLIVNNSCSTCSGENDQCEQECMLEVATKEIEYYDDEELVFEAVCRIVIPMKRPKSLLK